MSVMENLLLVSLSLSHFSCLAASNIVTIPFLEHLLQETSKKLHAWFSSYLMVPSQSTFLALSSLLGLCPRIKSPFHPTPHSLLSSLILWLWIPSKSQCLPKPVPQPPSLRLPSWHSAWLNRILKWKWPKLHTPKSPHLKRRHLHHPNSSRQH